MVNKTKEKVLDKFEKFQKNIEKDLKEVLEETNGQIQHKLNKTKDHTYKDL